MAIFDNEALEYDKWYSTKLGALVDEVETALSFKLIEPQKDMKILDFGCGTGNYSIKLAESGCLVTGMDISKKMLDIAEKKAEKSDLNIKFVYSESLKLPFKEETFDAALSIVTFDFIENSNNYFDEIFRVVKSGGRIVIGVINKDSSWGKLYQSEYFQNDSVFKYAHFFGKEDLKNIKKENLVEMGESLFFPPDTKEEELSIELERKLSNKNEGGFICGLWIK